MLRKYWRDNLYNIMRFGAALLTVLVLVCAPYLPKKDFSAFYDNKFYRNLFSETEKKEGIAEIKWHNPEKKHLYCNHQESEYVNCGFALSRALDYQGVIDFSSYEGMAIRANYIGPSKLIRIFIRNQDNKYSKEDDFNSLKFMSILIKAEKLNGEPVYIDFSEFKVAEWWAMQYNYDRKDGEVSLNQIVTLGIDFVDAGEHDLELIDIRIKGSWVDNETLYLGILVCWLLIVLLEGLLRFYQLHRTNKKRGERISDLIINNYQLTAEKELFERKAMTDPLTGILNRVGVERVLGHLTVGQRTSDYGLLLLDIDHFKRVNDRFGHDVGDDVLCSFAKTVNSCIREGDAFARWGGEEFILICPNTSMQRLRSVAEKIREKVHASYPCGKNGVPVTVSIGLSFRSNDERFEIVVKKADKALYSAKQSGRNRVYVAA